MLYYSRYFTRVRVPTLPGYLGFFKSYISHISCIDHLDCRFYGGRICHITSASVADLVDPLGMSVASVEPGWLYWPFLSWTIVPKIHYK